MLRSMRILNVVGVRSSMDRALVFGTRGCRFESCRARFGNSNYRISTASSGSQPDKPRSVRIWTQSLRRLSHSTDWPSLS